MRVAWPTELSLLAAGLEAQRLVAERDLLATILGDPVRGLAYAEREGINTSSFVSDDLACVWLGLLAARWSRELTGGGWVGGCRRADQVTAAQYVRAALEWGGYWNDDPLRVGFWNRRRVWKELVLQYPDAGDVPRFARIIREIDRRQREAAAALSTAVKLLTFGVMEAREAVRTSTIKLRGAA